MYCKDCKFRSEPGKHDFHPYCSNDKLTESDNSVPGFHSGGNRLLYSYSESGTFWVENYFGCVHFEEKKDERVLYACGYRDSDGSYGMWAGPSPSLLEMELYVPQEDEYPAFIIRLSGAAIVRRWYNGKWVE